jgi:hypothetical protein
MKKLTAITISLSVCLFGADFWQSKPFTDWSDKDVQKMIESSPWAKSISIPIGSEGPRPGGARRGSMGESDSPARSSSMGEDPMGNAGGGRGGRNRDGDSGVGEPVATTLVVVRWQTALPVKQALVKMKYGAEVSTSEEAKKILAADASTAYVIAITGIGSSMVRGDAEAIKKDLIEHTSLAVKGKDEIKPADIQLGRAPKGIEVYFVFPKKVEFSLDDKDVEFATKLGPATIKQKFRLKDMVYNGKLAL